MCTMAALPTLAVVTMVLNEAVMLPRWLAHYARETGGPDNLFVVDNETSDGSTDDLPCSVIRLPRHTRRGFETSRISIVSNLAAALLESYDAVAFTDADEFLVAEPERYPTLRHLLAARPDTTVLAAQGLNVLHHTRTEPPLDPARPILGQRRLVKFIPAMCKPSLKREPVPWAKGSHGMRTSYVIDPELFLFHMRFADIGLLEETAAHRQLLVRDEGRPVNSNWRMGADTLGSLLELITADVEAVEDAPEYRPRAQLLAKVPQDVGGGVTRSGRGQVPAMRKRPLERIPKRFEGIV
jgi:hypothetical protein